TLTRVELTWIAPAATTALLHSAWTFAPGRAPPELRTVPRLAAGSYRLHVRAQRGQTAREIERTIPFDSDAETVIVVP
ncbi:MAG: hypothetical protein HY744_09880, partial [Deltaproteobacteria bacterium]|nr:hypothetical protein [Deltaproteobacteria bacterium]